MAINSPQLRIIFNGLYAVFLFTKSDIRTCLILVVSTFVSINFRFWRYLKTLIAVSPLSTPIRLIDTMFWVWLHLLSCNLANEIQAIEEDKINKPSRPIPSGLITVHSATIVRLALVPICLTYSAVYSPQVALVSLALLLSTAWYNYYYGYKELFSKSVLSVAMHVLGELGGTFIAGKCCLTWIASRQLIALSRTRPYQAQSSWTDCGQDVACSLLLNGLRPRLQRHWWRSPDEKTYLPHSLFRCIPYSDWIVHPNVVRPPQLYVEAWSVMCNRVYCLQIRRRCKVYVVSHCRGWQAVVRILQCK